MLEPELLPLPELPPLLDELLPEGDMLGDSVELLLLEDELLSLELPPLEEPPPPLDDPPPPLDDPPPPLDDPPPPLDEPPPEELPPPPLDEGVPSVLLMDELGWLLEGVAVSVLLSDELDTDSVELGVGVPGSLLLLGLSLLLRLDVPLPGGCWVVAHTGI